MKRLGIMMLLLAACRGENPAPPRIDGQPPAVSGPVTLAIATHGTELELTLKNVSAGALQLATRVEADRIDFDWLEVRLTDARGATKTMRFVSAREKSARIETTLAPGAIDVERLDLAEWANHHGEELAPGVYQVEAIWDASRETGVAAFTAQASATLTVPAVSDSRCAIEGYRAPPGAKVQLLAHQVTGGGAVVDVGLHNAGTEAVCVWARIETHEVQSDWLTIQDGGRVLRLDDDRDKSAPVAVLLEPGATAWTTWDVGAWARRARNGGKALSSGSSWMTAIYDTTKETEVWAGKVQAQFELVAP
jgi:hypothetical protein